MPHASRFTVTFSDGSKALACAPTRETIRRALLGTASHVSHAIMGLQPKLSTVTYGKDWAEALEGGEFYTVMGELLQTDLLQLRIAALEAHTEAIHAQLLPETLERAEKAEAELTKLRAEAGKVEGLEIQQHLVISSGHISDKAAEFLNGQARPAGDLSDRLLIVDKVSEYGWRICLDPQSTAEFLLAGGVGKGLVEAVKFGLEIGVDWLQIDRDGPSITQLSVYSQDADGPAQTAQGYDEEDCYMDASNLAAKYGLPSGAPGEIVPANADGHPYHTVVEWRIAVGNGHTTLGYWDWLVASIQNDQR